MENIIESLSPIEIKILPYLHNSLDKIITHSGLDKTTVLRALSFLENKGLVKVTNKTTKIVDLGTNGIYYKKHHLPERKLLMTLETHGIIDLQQASEASKLSDNEFKVSLGLLKRKGLIEIKSGKLFVKVPKKELSDKMPEESFLDILPIEENKISLEQRESYESLKNRKDIIIIRDETETTITVTEKGKNLAGKKIESDLIEEVTPEIIKNYQKTMKFRKYDLNAPVPRINGGKRHFVNNSITEGKRVWTDLGFKEMSGDYVVTSFWNFDALFTAQDHPVREMQDTFFIKGIQGQLPSRDKVEMVKKSHENGVDGSKGWRYKWDENQAKKVLLRTHTTCLSAKKLAQINQKQLPAKFFSIGKCFRNETVDWSHGFEFNQSEGIVIDPNANFSHLLGYMKEFYRKMGFEKIRFRPSFFPYTEPSVEIDAFHPEKKIWLEIGGAGIFRPEVTVPLLGHSIPVLAWGPGFDRIMMLSHQIKDLREVYKNDLKKLKEM